MNRYGAGMLAIGVGLSMMAIVSCAEEQEIAPPEVSYGVTPCAECGMIVSEERYASATVVRLPEGRLESFAFDDANCMLAYQPAAGEVVQHYVHDYATRAWIPAEDAVYVHSVNLRTPMASGLAACSDQTGADALAEEVDGDVLRFADVRTRHEENKLSLLWLNERRNGQEDDS